MNRDQVGMLARAKAGHDAGKIYMIIDVKDEYVYLADGKIRKLSDPKKKKNKHVQLISKKYDVSSADDAQIRRILKEFNKEEEI